MANFDGKIKDMTDAEWIALCEARFSENFYGIAEDICKVKKERVIRLFGPTCSGKTTAARILTAIFSSFGKKAHLISLDDFFYDRERLLKMSEDKGISKTDYDSPATIDVEALGKLVAEIFESDTVHCPNYDFKVGKVTGYRTFKTDDDDVFIFEGIQANYRGVREMLSERGSSSIFIAPLSSVTAGGVEFEPNEIRFMRRLVRDFYFRNSSPEFTMRLWQSVRENEDKNIFPYAAESDYSVNSTMDYEIGVLKPFLHKVLEGVKEDSEFYGWAKDILSSVKNVKEIPAELIREGYLYCEFV